MRQPGRLVGQDVILPDNTNTAAIIAIDAEDNIHLLIFPANTIDSRFSKLDLKGLSIENHEWSISGHPAQTYLDVSCTTGTLPAFRRPFLRFAEDVLFEISNTKDTPADAVYRTGMKWKRFWSADEPAEVPLTWLHGLAGELSFLTHIVEKFGPETILNWFGPNGQDHDFQSGTDLAIEVKTSAEMPLTIDCNLRQLDTAIFKKLIIVCYHVAKSGGGVTLPMMVRQVELMIGDSEILDEFHKKLATAGYSRLSESLYEQHPLKISPASVFPVDDSFPKITSSSFASPLDHRISHIRYKVQLTGLTQVGLDDIEADLRLFGHEE